MQSGLSARLVDEKELVDKNYHKLKESLKIIDERISAVMQECG